MTDLGIVLMFQVASDATLVGLYAVPAARAQALAIGVWAALVVPGILARVVAMWFEGRARCRQDPGRYRIRDNRVM